MPGRAEGAVLARALDLSLALSLVLAVAAGCGSGRGVTHVVSRGENLFRIGKAYGIGYRELAAANGIRDPSRIEVGQKIFVPGARRRLPVEVIAPASASERRPEPSELPRPPLGATTALRWPTTGRLSSHFGPRNGTFHDGIDVAAPEGTPVHAARAGRVIYSDRIAGYGNIVIVDHGDGLTTVYAHNQRNEVREGDRVREGELVARVGSTGRTTGPNLHFEVRVREVARNPLFYLPALGGSIVAEGGR